MIRNQIILKPIITEKAMDQSGLFKYTFKIDRKATKPEIKKEIEKAYKVNVINVNIMNIRGKERRRGRVLGRTSSYKKAVVSLAPGQKIEIFEGA